jgi:predicted RNase H-like nuclease
LAGVVGLDQAWAAQGNKVGNVVFIDAASKRVLSKTVATDSIAELEGAVRESIKTARSSG